MIPLILSILTVLGSYLLAIVVSNKTKRDADPLSDLFKKLKK